MQTIKCPAINAAIRGDAFHPGRQDMNRATVFGWHGQTQKAGGTIIQGAPASHEEALGESRAGARIGLYCVELFLPWFTPTLAKWAKQRPSRANFSRVPGDCIPSPRHPAKSTLEERSI